MKNNINERTEYVTLSVTKAVKKDLDMAKDNHELKESIIRGFIQGEKNWLESEIKEVDETVIRYRAMLLKIKDEFSKSFSVYENDIEKIVEYGEKRFNSIKNLFNKFDENLKDTKSELSKIVRQIDSINCRELERLIELIERFSKMSSSEKEIVKLIMGKQNEKTS